MSAGSSDDHMMALAHEAHRSGDYEQVLRLIEPLLAQGHGEAHYLMADLYRWGNAVEEDAEQVVWHWERAVEAGHPRAMLDLGLLLRPGGSTCPPSLDCTPKNPERTTALFKQAMARFEEQRAAGDSIAMGFLALMYETGLGVQPDYATAIRLNEEAFAHGNFGVANALAQAYVNIFAPQLRDEEKAYHWYKELKVHGCQCIRIDSFEKRYAAETGTDGGSPLGLIPVVYTGL